MWMFLRPFYHINDQDEKNPRQNYMNAACLKCNLPTLNQYERFSKGDYVKQFKLSPNTQNQDFITNSYTPNRCDVSDLVCFSLTKGAMPCKPDQTLMLGYNVAGELVTTKIRH